ncbi:HNH endonuclease [Burkholderia pseudomallei]|nr:HNH endonuclease [Burkholderia pseudomallei]
MPAHPLRPCRHPGCGALVRAKHGLCDAHLQTARRAVDDRRGNANERGYTHRWRKAREHYLRLHPLCECSDCRAAGRLMPASVVDHIVPHRGDAHLFWDQSNWQAMSKSCHDRKTARENGGFGNLQPEARAGNARPSRTP